jgi:aspartate racemase
MIARTKNKTIGIVGGMGPEAGLNLMQAILNQTPAASDQDHLPVILMSLPGTITDRTSFLEGQTTINPAYSIAAIVKKLELAGADVVGLACNTTYSPGIFNVILQQLKQMNCNVQLINMPFETCRFIKENHKNVKRVGLMATNGTYKFGMYKSILQNFGYEVVLPDPLFQHNVIHNMIYNPVYGIKANAGSITQRATLLLERALGFFEAEQTDAVILGCTELSLLVKSLKVKTLPLIDASEVLALALCKASNESTASFFERGINPEQLHQLSFAPAYL